MYMYIVIISYMLYSADWYICLNPTAYTSALLVQIYAMEEHVKKTQIF